jgi:hypothetical protein
MIDCIKCKTTITVHESHETPEGNMCNACKIAELEVELALHEWVDIKERVPEESGYFQVLRRINTLPSTREYCFETNHWYSKDIICFWKPITLPAIGEEVSHDS